MFTIIIIIVIIIIIFQLLNCSYLNQWLYSLLPFQFYSLHPPAGGVS